jgi:hypothetical protein
MLEDLEQQRMDADRAWQWRLSHAEEDLKAARSQVDQERDLLVSAQEESERAVLRAMESFWVANGGKGGVGR